MDLTVLKILKTSLFPVILLFFNDCVGSPGENQTYMEKFGQIQSTSASTSTPTSSS
jgi:hypothetical protein